MTKEEVKTDIKKFSALEAVSNSEGGKILVTSLEKDITSSVDELSGKYKTATLNEMVALCARLSERLSMLRAIKGASKLKKLAKEELAFLLKE